VVFVFLSLAYLAYVTISSSIHSPASDHFALPHG
jgi:hypothetical protein